MNTYPKGLLDKELILGMFDEKMSKAEERFKEFNEAENEDICIDEKRSKRLTDDEARTEIIKMISANEMINIKSMPKSRRDELLLKIKQIEGLTQRQAARILGMSQNLVFKV